MTGPDETMVSHHALLIHNGFAIGAHEGEMTVCWNWEMLVQFVSWFGILEFVDMFFGT